MRTLEERVRDMERTNRHYRWALMLGGGAVVALLWCQFQSGRVPDVIRARKFEVVDREGLVSVALGTRMQAVGGYVFVFSREGEVASRLAVDMHGNGMVTTGNGRGQNLVEIGGCVGQGFVTTLGGGRRIVGIVYDGGNFISQHLDGNRFQYVGTHHGFSRLCNKIPESLGRDHDHREISQVSVIPYFSQ